MKLIKLTDTNGTKHIINTDYIMDVFYVEETDLTEIVFSRSAYHDMYIRGDITNQIIELSNVKGSYVGEII